MQVDVVGPPDLPASEFLADAVQALRDTLSDVAVARRLVLDGRGSAVTIRNAWRDFVELAQELGLVSDGTASQLWFVLEHDQAATEGGAV